MTIYCLVFLCCLWIILCTPCDITMHSYVNKTLRRVLKHSVLCTNALCSCSEIVLFYSKKKKNEVWYKNWNFPVNWHHKILTLRITKFKISILNIRTSVFQNALRDFKITYSLFISDIKNTSNPFLFYFNPANLGY